MTEKLSIGDRDVLLVVDIQNDFCPRGGLAVPRGDEVVPVINLLARRFEHVVLTQDWHPRGHQSFCLDAPRPIAIRDHHGRIWRTNPLARSLRARNGWRRVSRRICKIPHVESWSCAKAIIATSTPTW